jgi:hypothetical protein
MSDWFRVMVFNAIFNNNSVASWRSIVLVEEIGVPEGPSVLLVLEAGVLGENHRLVASHRQTLSYNVAPSTPRHEEDSNSQR